jgi:hypothetical protein
MQSRCLFTNNNYKCIFVKKKNPFRKKCQTKNLPDSDPDLNSISLVRFDLKFDYILHHIQKFTRRRMLNVK